MTKALTKVIYRPDHQSISEYTVIVNPEEVRRHLSPALIIFAQQLLEPSTRNGKTEVSMSSQIACDQYS